MSSAQKNAQFFNFSVLDSVLYTTATTNKLLRLPPLFHFLHLCSSSYNIVMSRRQHGKRSQEVCIDLIDQYQTDYPTAPLECILHSISTRHHVSTRQLCRWYYHYLHPSSNQNKYGNEYDPIHQTSPPHNPNIRHSNSPQIGRYITSHFNKCLIYRQYNHLFE